MISPKLPVQKVPPVLIELKTLPDALGPICEVKQFKLLAGLHIAKKLGRSLLVYLLAIATINIKTPTPNANKIEQCDVIIKNYKKKN